MSIAVYIYMAESDEYYGSRRAQEAYDGLHNAYLDAGLKEAEIVHLLVLNLLDDAYFNEYGIYNNYHGGATIIFEDEEILNWILTKHK